MEKLNASLAFLQTEMQRLAQQQEVLMAMRGGGAGQAWVIPPTTASPSPQKHGRASAVTRSSGPSSPADSPRSARRSPTAITRKSASFHARTPRTASSTTATPTTPRPSELKIAPYSRVLTAPHSVDSIPRRRRFSPCGPPPQGPAEAFVYMGDKPAGGDGAVPPDWGERRRRRRSQDTDPLLLSPEREEASSSPASVSPLSSPAKRAGGDQEEGQEEDLGRSAVGGGGDGAWVVSEEVLAHAVTERFTPVALGPPWEGGDGAVRSSLVEVPLSVLKPLEGGSLEETGEGLASMEGLDDDLKTCCGFFFKDDGKGEDGMAQRRAALLEKRQRRERETQQKKQQLEAEQEQRKEEARVKAEEERVRKEEERARREFIKQEYLRRKQLKLMEDMDTVLRPRPPSTRRRARPKSLHRDRDRDRDGTDTGPKTPARGQAANHAPGSPARVFSVSSLSLASLNLADGESTHSEKRTPRLDSADGCRSPSGPGSGNGEKDWENASTTSSLTSNTEYTGPRLYKEPSAKSNKHIIQNAMAHCCLAGKVNEGQKNKILEEMERCEANNFLVLFRDAGCQFRSLYAYFPETEDISKLAGVGPRSITRKMIDGLFKYNSDRKQFSQIPAKTMSASVDAITIHSHLWQKKPATPKKVVAPAKS